jgi:hypothetical protein
MQRSILCAKSFRLPFPSATPRLWLLLCAYADYAKLHEFRCCCDLVVLFCGGEGVISVLLRFLRLEVLLSCRFGVVVVCCSCFHDFNSSGIMNSLLVVDIYISPSPLQHN